MTSSPVGAPAPLSDDAAAQSAEAKAQRLLRKKMPLLDKESAPLDAPTPLSSESFQRLDPSLLRILHRLPSDVAGSLTERQIQALHQAIAQPARHSIDLRKTLSIFCWRYYFVFLAGPERRAPTRLQKSRRPWSAASTAIATLLLLGAGLAIYQITYRRLLEVPAPKTSVKSTAEVHPTALPWIERPADCRGAKRQWKDGMCYDSEHSPEF